MIIEDKSRLSTYRCLVCGRERPWGVGHTEELAKLRCMTCGGPTRHLFTAVNEYLIQADVVGDEDSKVLRISYTRTHPQPPPPPYTGAMSPEGRANISEAAKVAWARRKAEQANGV